MFTIVDALTSIKRNVAHYLTADSIHRACRFVGHQWRDRDLSPAGTIHAFLLQVLHGNTACTHTVRLADLSCSAASAAISIVPIANNHASANDGPKLTS